MGRRRLAELSGAALANPLTEQQVRHRLDQLENWGLVTKSRGQYGTKVTTRGDRVLKFLSRESGL